MNNHRNVAMTHREIGEALGIPYQEVFYIEQKALKKLRKRLATFFAESEPNVKQPLNNGESR